MHVGLEEEGGWQKEKSRGCWGREKRIAEANEFFLWPSRILNDSAAGRSWGCTSEWYIFTCALNPPALIWQDQIVAADTKQAGDRDAARAYSVISDLGNVKGKVLEAEMIDLCYQVGCSSGLAQTLFWVLFTSPRWGTWRCVCQLLSSPWNSLTSSDRMHTCLVQPICVGSQSGSEHSMCLLGLWKWSEDFSSNKWTDFLPLLRIQKQLMLAKEHPSTQKPSLCQWC